MITISEIAKMIDHSILHPTFTDDDLKRECEIALKYKVATVCVKPYHVKMAHELLMGSDVEVCAVIGFPHGNSSIQLKCLETEQVIQDGATEVDMVINIGKVLQNDWDYVDRELQAINKVCLTNGAILKVIFETDYVNKDQDIKKLCELCSTNKVAFVKTSSGYGFVKGSDGKYSYEGASDRVLKLMRAHSHSDVQVKAAGGVRDLNRLLEVRDFGVTRVGATATATIIKEAKKRL